MPDDVTPLTPEEEASLRSADVPLCPPSVTRRLLMPMVVTPLSHRRATALIHELAREEQVTFGPHALDEMAADYITILDVMHALTPRARSRNASSSAPAFATRSTAMRRSRTSAS